MENRAIDYLIALGKKIKAGLFPEDKVHLAEQKNPWFTAAFIHYALQALADQMLRQEYLKKWRVQYDGEKKYETVGLVFAGNIPLVGFHDFLCAYAAGCHLKIKYSTKDETLFPALMALLRDVDSDLDRRVEQVDTLKNFDAVIATGSNNTHRYFDYYFRNYPHILRANRNAVAVLSGDETPEQLQCLADDIFLYFGFGCRNVSKLYVPLGYRLENLFPHFEKYRWLHQHTKYMSNYDYQRTLLLMNKTPHYANEFVMLKEDNAIASPIATLHYEYWHDEQLLRTQLKQQADKIQCVASSFFSGGASLPVVALGQTQIPSLNDYADGVDVMRFLLG